MKIALDLDDVVLDFVGALTEALRMEYGVELTTEDITEWDLNKALNPIIGYSWWDWWRKRDWLWARASAIPGAVGGITKLREAGHYVEIVTSKPEWAEAQTWRWLGKWRPPVQRVTIVNEDVSKADVTDADVLIDDRPSNCEGWAKTSRTALLFTRPHNQILKLNELYPGRIVRVLNWQHVLDVIEVLEDLDD